MSEYVITDQDLAEHVKVYDSDEIEIDDRAAEVYEMISFIEDAVFEYYDKYFRPSCVDGQLFAGDQYFFQNSADGLYTTGRPTDGFSVSAILDKKHGSVRIQACRNSSSICIIVPLSAENVEDMMISSPVSQINCTQSEAIDMINAIAQARYFESWTMN